MAFYKDIYGYFQVQTVAEQASSGTSCSAWGLFLQEDHKNPGKTIM